MNIESNINNCIVNITILRTKLAIRLSGRVSPLSDCTRGISFQVKAIFNETLNNFNSINNEVKISNDTQQFKSAEAMLDGVTIAKELIQYYTNLITVVSNTSSTLNEITESLKNKDYKNTELLILLSPGINASFIGTITNSENFNPCISAVLSAKLSTRGIESLSENDCAAYRVAYTLAYHSNLITKPMKGKSEEEVILSILRPTLLD